MPTPPQAAPGRRLLGVVEQLSQRPETRPQSPAEADRVALRALLKTETEPVARALFEYAQKEAPTEAGRYAETLGCAGVLIGDACTTYCRRRWCLVCARNEVGRLLSAYGGSVSRLVDPQLVTLTVPRCTGAELPGVLDEILAVWKSTSRAVRRTDGFDLTGIRKLECVAAPGEYGPHVHAILDGAEAAGRVVERWNEAAPCGAEPEGQDVRPIAPQTARHALAYVSKAPVPILDAAGDPVAPQALHTAFSALHSRRVVQAFGMRSDAAERHAGAHTGKRGGAACFWDTEAGGWVNPFTGEITAGAA